jgi:inosine/xanthosine triphosphatase
MKLALGTTSKYKVHAIQSVIHELEMDCEIYPVAAESEISDQPHSKDETKNGAVNRAKNAIKLVDDADLGLGVEFGYEPFEDDKYHMVCWAAVV